MTDRLLVLVRHGQSEWNLKNLFTGWRDVDLTEQGVTEAREAGRKLKAQGHHVRRRLHLGAQARAAHARPDAGGDGPDRHSGDQGPGAQRARLRRSVRPQQGRRPQEMGRGAGAHLAPLLRRRAARRREPARHRGARAALLHPGNPAARAARRARAGVGARQFAARAGDGARQARRPRASSSANRAPACRSSTGSTPIRRWRRSSIWRRNASRA